jgi:hypothetical protein
VLEASILLVEFPILLFVLLRAGLLPFPTGFMAYLFVAQVTLVLYSADVIQYAFLDTWSRGGARASSAETVQMFTALFLLAPICCHGRFRLLRSTMAQLAALRNLPFGRSRWRLYLSIATAALAVHTALWLALVDPGAWWLNFHYPSRIARASLGSLPLVGAVFLSSPLVSMGCSALFVLAVNQRLRGFALIFGFLALFHFVTFLGIHSRVSVLTPAIVGMLWWFFRIRFRRTVLLGSLGLAVGCLAFSLRGRGLPEHGVSTIPETLQAMMGTGFGDHISTLMTNLTEGVFVVAEGFKVHHTYSFQYIILSFSPLPSIIDGYAAVYRGLTFRLSTYVPGSGLMEVVNYGAVYLLILFAIYYSAIRFNLLFVRRNPVLFIACNFLIFFSLYHIMDYPLRNALKYLWMSVYIQLAVLIAGVLFRRQRRYGRLPERARHDQGYMSSPGEPASEHH